QADDPGAAFMRDLEIHTSEGRGVYNRVFVEGARSPAPAADQNEPASTAVGLDDEASRLIKQASARVQKAVRSDSGEVKHSHLEGPAIERLVEAAVPSAINASRSLRNLAAWADSFATYTTEQLQASGWAVGRDW